MSFFEDIIKVIPEAAGEPYVLAAITIVIGGWLFYINRRQRSKDFIIAGESLIPEERLIFYKNSGYSYDELASLTKEQKLSVITKKYKLFAYIATLFFIIFCLVAILDNRQDDLTIKVSAKINEAKSLYQKGRFGDAYVAYKEADTLASGKSYKAKYGAAKSLTRKGAYDEALPLINSGIKNTPSNRPVLKSKFYSLFSLYLKNSERRDEALEYLNKSIEALKGCISKECVEQLAATYGNIGNTYGYIGKHQESEKYLKKAIAQDLLANDRRGYLADRANLASLYHRMNKNEESVVILNENLQEWLSLEAHYDVAYTRYKLARSIEENDPEAASVHYSEALRYINEHKVDDERLKARIIGDHAKLYIKNTKDLNQALLKTAKSLSANINGDDKSGIAVQLSSFFYLYKKNNDITCAAVTGLSSMELLRSINSDYYNEIKGEYKNYIKIKSEANSFKYPDFIASLAKCTDVAKNIWSGVFTTMPKVEYKL